MNSNSVAALLPTLLLWATSHSQFLCFQQGQLSPSRGKALPGSALIEGRAELSQSAGSSVQVCPGQLHPQHHHQDQGGPEPVMSGSEGT